MYFAFCCLCFWGHDPINHCQAQLVELLVQVFLLRVLAPTFRSQTHLGSFVYVVNNGSPTSFFGIGISSFLSTVCWKDCPFPKGLSTLTENRLTVWSSDYFWCFYSIDLCIYIFMPTLHRADSYRPVISFEMWDFQLCSSVFKMVWLFGVPNIPSLCYILLLEAGCWVQPAVETRLHEGCACQEEGVTGSHSRGCLPPTASDTYWELNGLSRMCIHSFNTDNNPRSL